MKLPAKIEYAYKAVLELAIRYNGNVPIQINTICGSQKIPKKFLIHLLLRLKNANVINSSRGVTGGYYLTRPPYRISLSDVFKAIDDNIIVLPDKTKSVKGSEADRLIFNVMEKISKSIGKQLEEITYDKLVSQIANEQPTYNI